MGQETISSFTGGLISDLNPITTPKTVLTDCLNGSLLTMNGNELILQNDMGNTTIGDAKLSNGFIPLGVKESGGIVYIVSYSPSQGKTEIGSFPSPNYLDATIIPTTPDPSNIITKQVIIPGEFIPSTDINNTGKTIYLSDHELSVGEPFMVILNLDETTEKPLISNLIGNRNYYIPKLISITASGEIDITDKVSIQKYYDNKSTDNFWFLSKPISNTFQEYITANLTQRYKNIKSGILGIRFDLESIDKFHIKSDNNGNYFPILKYVNVDQSYTVNFDGFYIEHPSLFKCNKISMIYHIYDNITGALDSSNVSNPFIIENTTTTIGHRLLTDSNSIVATNIVSDINNVIPRKFEIAIPNKNKTMEYTIIPSNSYYDYEFTKFIISDRIDLSKDALTWGLKPYLALITVPDPSYAELIDDTKLSTYLFLYNLTHPSVVNSTGSTISLVTDAFTITTISNIEKTITIPNLALNMIAPDSGDFTGSVTYSLFINNDARLILAMNTFTGVHNANYYNFGTSFAFQDDGKKDNSYVLQIDVNYDDIDSTNVTSEMTLSTPINLTYGNTSGYKIHPLIGSFGYLNNLVIKLDKNNVSIINSGLKQAIYKYINYTGDISNYEQIGTFTINDNNIAVLTPHESDLITVRTLNIV